MTSADFARQVRDALAQLYDSVYLQAHPLAGPHHGLLGGRGGAAARPAHAGRVLRQRLLDAIARLRPEGKAGEAAAGAARRHRLLELRYVEALDPPAVQAQLGIGQSQYYREHARALEALVVTLADDLHLAGLPVADTGIPVGAQGLDVDDTVGAPPGELPAILTSFVGREQELIAVRERLLDPGVRLLTLSGPGGVGKTRLALALAADVRPAFPDGVGFVDLAPLRDAGLVLAEVARALGLPEVTGRTPAEQLRRFVREKALLLVLDNFEHLLDAAPTVTRLLAAGAQLKVLVTSRAVLRVQGEHVAEVPPLAVPPAPPSAPVGPLPAPGRGSLATEHLSPAAAYPAVRLLVERARAADAAFVLTPENVRAAAEICRLLDGLPLALELAAARIPLLPPGALLTRLARRLPLLTGGRRDAPARQQTLRAALDWSHDLLAPGERTLFRRLAVFADGGTLAAAEAVCAPDGKAAEGTEGVDVLADLASLVDKSLLQRQDPGTDEGPRFDMLETVREYAGERLEQTGEAEAARRRHAGYFLGLARRAAGAAHGPDQGIWFDRLERERGNLREAFGWAITHGDTDAAVCFVETLRWFWEVRGHLAEGRRQTEAVLALPTLSTAAAPGLRARALAVAAHLAHLDAHLAAAVDLAGTGAALGDGRSRADALLWLAAALFRRGGSGGAGRPATGAAPSVPGASRALLEESLSLWRDAGETWGVAQALEYLGMVARDAGDLRGAHPHYEAALARRRELGDARGVAQTLQSLANLAFLEGQYAAAIACSEESLATARTLGDRRRVASSLNTLSMVAQALGDPALAAQHLEAQLAAAQEADDPGFVALAAYRLAALAAGRGEAESAAQLYVVSLRRCVQSASREGTARCLVGLAAGALARGQAERAGRLLGAATGVREAPGFFDAHLALWPRVPESAGGSEGPLRRALAAYPQAATWIQVGRLLPLAQVVDEAAAAAAAVPEDGGRDGSAPLSPREWEVVRLLADGLTNRQLATRLVVTEATAARHVANILNKLGVHNRTQAAAWAVEHLGRGPAKAV